MTSGLAMDHARTDVELVVRAQAGDGAAQQELWRLHRRWVAAIIIAHRPRGIDVDDLMQDVAVKLISRVDTLRDPEAFRPWLRQIILNICRGAARQQRPTLSLTGGPADDSARLESFVPESTEPTVGRAIDTPDHAGRLMAQAMTLPAEYREPLLLRCVRALTYQQIAQILELPVTTIETRLARARRMLREELGDDFAADATP
ncbi:MAG: sigma-70 family RNA polymerase sigma factor [Phycisphaerales bacterium]|nr:sigma-70 family RNA polymerase sigma factor [Phycisphaerales bacterium]